MERAAAQSDRQKAEELIQVLVNMRGKNEDDTKPRCFHQLTERTLHIVKGHHVKIASIANSISVRVKFFGQLVTLSCEEFDSLLELHDLKTHH
jgi:hypothetical protein